MGTTEGTMDRASTSEVKDKRHVNMILIGHVDHGKSTLGGQILILNGQVDERTIEKYKKLAKENSRESWFVAYILDTGENERDKGKTVEVGSAHFETENTRFTLLDAPGHKNYVANMIGAASQADVGVLVVSSRSGEFESGFERGGQTIEHVQLAKTLGVTKLIVAVNKMDDPTVNWCKERFDEIKSKMTPFLKSAGYKVKQDVQFLPVSALLGINLDQRMDSSVCSWWKGSCLFEALDTVEILRPSVDSHSSFRLPISAKYKESGTIVMGKVESGVIHENDTLLVMPNRVQVKVIAIEVNDNKVAMAEPGESITVKLSGIEEDEVSSGFVLSSLNDPVPMVNQFVARLQICNVPESGILSSGYKGVLHIHSAVVECEIIQLMYRIDKKTNKRERLNVPFVKKDDVVDCRIQMSSTICIEKFSNLPQMGRFTLRSESLTVAQGRVIDFSNERDGV